MHRASRPAARRNRPRFCLGAGGRLHARSGEPGLAAEFGGALLARVVSPERSRGAVWSRADVSGNGGTISAMPRRCQAIFSSPGRTRMRTTGPAASAPPLQQFSFWLFERVMAAPGSKVRGSCRPSTRRRCERLRGWQPRHGVDGRDNPRVKPGDGHDEDGDDIGARITRIAAAIVSASRCRPPCDTR